MLCIMWNYVGVLSVVFTQCKTFQIAVYDADLCGGT